MKKKLEFLSALIMLCIIILFNSCENNKYNIQIPEKVVGGLNITARNLPDKIKTGTRLAYEFEINNSNEGIKFNSFVSNNKLHSIISYRNDKSEWINISSYCIDLSDKNYKSGMNIVVKKQADSLRMHCEYSKIDRIGIILDGLPELLFNKLGEKDYFNESTLSIFYHLGAFNAARRAYDAKSEDCQCGIYDSFVNNESPFFCAEDKIVSADEAYEFIREISEKGNFAGKKFQPKTLLNYLKSESGKFISVSKIDKIFKNEAKYFWNTELTKNERIKVYSETHPRLNVARLKSGTTEVYDGWPIDPSCFLFGVSAGSDCGCCGNYSGPCWTCSLACSIHDQTCTTCEPSWYCFSGCVPGPC